MRPRRVFARARPAQTPGGMNKTEAAYALTLEARKRSGEVADYWFEGLKLRLGKACFYTPDFVVQLADGVIELHEIKGHWEDDARVKVRVVADKYPFRLIAVQRDGRAGWKVEELA
jgi:hypothetical protein